MNDDDDRKEEYVIRRGLYSHRIWVSRLFDHIPSDCNESTETISYFTDTELQDLQKKLTDFLEEGEL